MRIKQKILRSHLTIYLVGISLLIVSCKTEQSVNQSKTSQTDLPKIKTPAIKTPAIKTPEIKTPEIKTPEITPPAIPTVQIPQINIPEITIPEIKVQENQDYFVITLPAEILFDFDQATLLPDALTTLKQVKAVLISRYPNATILVAGHTDSKGSTRYNQSLSERRAKAVKTWLVSTGKLNENRLVAHGYGESQTVASNKLLDGTDNPSGRQQNRRVELIIQNYSTLVS